MKCVNDSMKVASNASFSFFNRYLLKKNVEMTKIVFRNKVRRKKVRSMLFAKL